MAQYVKGFKGNPRIRSAGTPITWTEKTISEFEKCSDDPEYFIRTYVLIKSVDEESLITFEPRFYQLDMLDKMLNNRFVIVKLPRQCGKTTLTAAVLLWHVIFKTNFSILIAAHKGDKARDVLGTIREMYECLPDFLQHGVESWNKGSIQLSTGSRIRSSATSGSAARGDVYNLVYIDEMAFIAKHVAEDFVKSVIPTVSSGKTTKVFITSTPKGLNMFYDMWKAAVEKRSSYQYVEIKWNDVPGRDEAFKADIIAQFGQEYFDQEYAAEFIGSSRTLIAGHKLLSIQVKEPISQTDRVRVYAPPEPGRSYVMTVDVSEGLGEDYHAIVVVDVTEMPYSVAAVYRDNLLDPMALPGVIYDMARSYNEALVLVEANFGQQVGRILYSELEYENVVFTSKGKNGPDAKVDKISGGFNRKTRVGLLMGAQSKRIGCSNLKTLVEQDQLLLNDQWIYDELTRFVVKKKSYAGEDGHDDLAMCLVMFAWMVDQGYVRDSTSNDVRKRIAELRAQAIEDEMLPVGFHGFGDEQEEPVAIDIGPPAIDVPGDDGEPHPWADMFSNTKGGLSEAQLHDEFMKQFWMTHPE